MVILCKAQNAVRVGSGLCGSVLLRWAFGPTLHVVGVYFFSSILDTASESGLLIRLAFWPDFFNMFSLPHQL